MAPELSPPPSFSPHRRWSIGFNVLLILCVVFSVVVMVNYLSRDYFWRVHWGNRGRAELSPLTVKFLQSLTNQVKVTLYYKKDEPLYTTIAALLNEYRMINPRVTIQAVDYLRDPGTAQKVKEDYKLVSVTDQNLVIFDCEGRTQVVNGNSLAKYVLEQVHGDKEQEFQRRPTEFLGEKMFTSALLTVANPKPLNAYVVKGHGEHPIDGNDPTGYLKFGAMLEQQNNVRVFSLSLRGTNPIPLDCHLLIIAGPRSTFFEPELQKIDQYLAQGGRLFALFGPSTNRDSGLEQVLAKWGVEVGTNVIKDPDNTLLDVAMVVSDFSSHPIVNPLLQSQIALFTPRSVGKAKDRSQAADAPKAEEIAFTGPRAFSSSDPDGRRRFPLIVAVEKGGIKGAITERGATRIVVVGSSTFLANVPLDSAANRDFAGFAVNWLLDRTQLLDALGPQPVTVYRLVMTRAQLQQAQWILLAGMPGVTLVVGGLCGSGDEDEAPLSPVARMNPRSTGLWLVLAAGLFAFIFFYQRHARKPEPGPLQILPALQPSHVTAIQVLPKDQGEIHVERSNSFWEITRPLVYPAQSVSIENLLTVLARLTPAAFIPQKELQNRFNADEEYGFANPQASLVLYQGTHRTHLRIGRKTAPGDQVFLQVVGVDGVYVVDADLLKLVPRTANAWRDPTFIDLATLVLDRIAVTNGSKIFELKREGPGQPWRMLSPTPARANNARIEEALQNLQSLRILQFVSDSPKADFELFKLQPPEWELALGHGTNNLALLQFGKAATNDPAQVYARRIGQPAIVAVASNLLAAWRDPANDFRDPHLLTLTEPVDLIEVKAADSFSLQRQTNNSWRVLPQNFPADPGLVKNLLSILSGMPIVQFVKDAVTEPDLPVYGLAAPDRRFILKSCAPGTAETNSTILADLSFGTNQANKVFVRRADESFVYAVERDDVDHLPSASCQLRERHIWNLSPATVASVTIRQNGKARQIIRKGDYEWSLGPGSQGIIDPLPIEETVKGLCQLEATEWMGRGDKCPARFGFETNRLQIVLQLKNNEQMALEFGGEAIPGFPYTSVVLDGEPWVCRISLALCRDVLLYLTIPAGSP